MAIWEFIQVYRGPLESVEELSRGGGLGYQNPWIMDSAGVGATPQFLIWRTHLALWWLCQLPGCERKPLQFPLATSCPTYGLPMPQNTFKHDQSCWCELEVASGCFCRVGMISANAEPMDKEGPLYSYISNPSLAQQGKYKAGFQGEAGGRDFLAV